MDLLPGVRSSLVDTDRIRMHVLESGPDDGVPLVLVHGNLSTSRFVEHLMPGLPGRYRVMVGLYDAATLKRLPRGDGGGDAVEVGVVDAGAPAVGG